MNVHIKIEPVHTVAYAVQYVCVPLFSFLLKNICFSVCDPHCLFKTRGAFSQYMHFTV